MKIKYASKCTEKQPGLGRRAVPRAQAHPAEDEAKASSPGHEAHPQRGWRKGQATWERTGRFQRADSGKWISAIRWTDVAHRGEGLGADKGGHRRGRLILQAEVSCPYKSKKETELELIAV